MKKNSLIIIVYALSFNIIMGQENSQKTSNSEEIKEKTVIFKHSIGSSLFMLFNLTDESADYGLLTYGYWITEKDRVFAEFVTWKYSEPMGTYGDSEEFYPGFVRCFGLGIGYQRFLWKGLYAAGSATNFYKQYYDEQDNKTQNGYQLYLQVGIGYRFEFFNDRFYIEPAGFLKFWPIDTNVPADFKAIEEGTPATILEPSLNFGFNF